MTGVLHSWAFFLAAGAGACVWWLLAQARHIEGPNWPCWCGHRHDAHAHYTRSTYCAVPGCECVAYGGMSVHAARRRDVASVRRLQPPPRDAVTTHPEYDTAAMDRMVDDVERGA